MVMMRVMRTDRSRAVAVASNRHSFLRPWEVAPVVYRLPGPEHRGRMAEYEGVGVESEEGQLLGLGLAVEAVKIESQIRYGPGGMKHQNTPGNDV